MKAHLHVLTFSRVRSLKWVAPIHALMVPNGCSAVWRRMRMLRWRGVRPSISVEPEGGFRRNLAGSPCVESLGKEFNSLQVHNQGLPPQLFWGSGFDR